MAKDITNVNQLAGTSMIADKRKGRFGAAKCS